MQTVSMLMDSETKAIILVNKTTWSELQLVHECIKKGYIEVGTIKTNESPLFLMQGFRVDADKEIDRLKTRLCNIQKMIEEVL